VIAFVFAPKLFMKSVENIFRVGEVLAKAATERHVVLAALQRLDGTLHDSR
jgi:hypothetical protein